MGFVRLFRSALALGVGWGARLVISYPAARGDTMVADRAAIKINTGTHIIFQESKQMRILDQNLRNSRALCVCDICEGRAACECWRDKRVLEFSHTVIIIMQPPATAASLARRVVVAAVTRGYEALDGYTPLLARNRAIRDLLWARIADNADVQLTVWLGHEGNIDAVEQAHIQAATPDMPLVFSNLKTHFETAHRRTRGAPEEGAQHSPQCALTANTTALINWPSGYRAMCLFWFVDFVEALAQYDFVLWIDEDVVLSRFAPELLARSTSRLATVRIQREMDDAWAIVGLCDWLCLEVFFRGDRAAPRPCSVDDHWTSPYTNVLWVDLRWARDEPLLAVMRASPTLARGVYGCRWGDLPLWGAALAALDTTPDLLESAEYWHGSHAESVVTDTADEYRDNDSVSSSVAPAAEDGALFAESQTGQDWHVADVIFDGLRGGFFVELGALDGVRHSNTLLLQRARGWTGVCIEPNRAFADALRRNRADGCRCVHAAVDGFAGGTSFAQGDDEDASALFRPDNVGLGSLERDADVGTNSSSSYRVAVRTLGSILDEASAPKFVHYLSLDVEGAEFRILEAIDLDKYAFGYLAIEHNYQEPKRQQIRALLRSKGYLLFRENQQDDDFVHPDVFARLSEPSLRLATGGLKIKLIPPNGAQLNTLFRPGLSVDVGDDAFARRLQAGLQRGERWAVCLAATPHPALQQAHHPTALPRCVDLAEPDSSIITDPWHLTPSNWPYTITAWLQPSSVHLAGPINTQYAAGTVSSSITITATHQRTT